MEMSRTQYYNIKVYYENDSINSIYASSIKEQKKHWARDKSKERCGPEMMTTIPFLLTIWKSFSWFQPYILPRTNNLLIRSLKKQQVLHRRVCFHLSFILSPELAAASWHPSTTPAFSSAPASSTACLSSLPDTSVRGELPSSSMSASQSLLTSADHCGSDISPCLNNVHDFTSTRQHSH